MSTQTIFWFLFIVTSLEIAAIFVVGHALQSVLKSDNFKNKLNIFDVLKGKSPAGDDEKGIAGYAIVAIAMMLVVLPALGFYKWEWNGDPLGLNVSLTSLYIILGFDLLLFWVLSILHRLLFKMIHIDKSDEELAIEQKSKVSKKWDIMKILTDAVPVSEEASVETDHEYDGIRELDNNLPPWWKWGFYLTIVIGVIYLLNYHVFETGDLQETAYRKEMAQAQKDIEAYLIKQALNVDENSVTLMESPSDIAQGKKIFEQYCKVCHGANGEGIVGPNFSDRYWIYGNDIKDLFGVIKYGAKNGMKSWKDELNPVQMQQVASYIKSFEGTSPANPKEPQGEFYPPENEGEDTTLISVNVE